jgi:general transcriptional corepressor CYC8
MSLRHTPRQAERERDVRLHEIHPHPHVLGPPPSHGPGHPPPPHVNGGMPAPGALVNGPPHPAHQMVSPTVVPAPANGGQPVPPSIQKLASANEQTWLLIGG